MCITMFMLFLFCSVRFCVFCCSVNSARSWFQWSCSLHYRCGAFHGHRWVTILFLFCLFLKPLIKLIFCFFFSDETNEIKTYLAANQFTFLPQNYSKKKKWWDGGSKMGFNSIWLNRRFYFIYISFYGLEFNFFKIGIDFSILFKLIA